MGGVMRSLSIASIAVLSVLPLLQASNTASAHTRPCDNLSGWGIYVAEQGLTNIQSVEEYIIEFGEVEGAVRQILGELRTTGELDLDDKELANLLIELRETPARPRDDLPEALQGIGGFVVATFLRKYLDPDGNVVSPGEKSIHDTRLYGKIRDYTLLKDGTGHLSVDTCIVEAITGNWQFYHWDIEVKEPPFNISAENSPDPYRPQLDHKLTAEGDAIDARSIYIQDPFNPINPIPNLTLLDKSAPHHLYERTDASCIDLFTVGVPPATFGELIGSAYCLGRCADPPIVNSGD